MKTRKPLTCWLDVGEKGKRNQEWFSHFSLNKGVDEAVVLEMETQEEK